MAQDIAYQSSIGRSNVAVSESRPLPVVLTALTGAALTRSTVTMTGYRRRWSPPTPPAAS